MFRLRDSIVRRSCGNLWHVFLAFLSALPFLTPRAALEASTRRTSRAKKSLKPAELRLQTLVLFPVSQSYKLIQNFLQSLERPFLSAIIIPAFNAVTGI